MSEIVGRGLRRLAPEDGQTTVEYVLVLAAVIALVGVVSAGISGLGGPLSDLLQGLF